MQGGGPMYWEPDRECMDREELEQLQFERLPRTRNRIHASSGTTGASTVVGYTRNDIRIWSNLTARVLTMGGVTKDDVVQIAFGYGLFTGGFGLHYGAERIGASVIPASSGHTLRQIKIMMDLKNTALVSTPSSP